MENLLGLMVLPFAVSLLIFGGAGSQMPIEEHSLLLSVLHKSVSKFEATVLT